ncbi:hypothetical protein SAMN05216266_107282 [Amycolatopsis marina]|uniref:DUF6292 domain-containing protein n=1 Tax=Amycolatopsis marina TaxID=490629 RepID=A0A1I0ZTL5_9PSEU|nr:DUF6292 family protein [Amycolatopsis marina]SFB29015.1 hypothetical protein SAMN05216266_107282 [Amycolatopsis marina]
MRTKSERVPSAEDGLAGYVRSVAALIGVPPEGTTCEISDSANAYLAVARRCRRHPDDDVMLLWNERDGWHAALETLPGEQPAVLAYLGGPLVPAPDAVAEFAESVIAGRPVGQRNSPDLRPTGTSDHLASVLAVYAPDPALQ